MSNSVFLIPGGPKNLASLFPSVDWNNVDNYFVEVFDNNGTQIATSPVNQMDGCNCDDCVRLHFLNYLGAYDAVNFGKPHIIHEDTADEYQNALNYPLNKTDTGIERFNVNSNDTYEAKHKCKESDMPWLQELADSPKMFLEWTGIEGQPDDYIPVVKIADKFDKLKNVDEWDYEFVIQFKLSNSFISLRN